MDVFSVMQLKIKIRQTIDKPSFLALELVCLLSKLYQNILLFYLSPAMLPPIPARPKQRLQILTSNFVPVKTLVNLGTGKMCHKTGKLCLEIHSR